MPIRSLTMTGVIGPIGAVISGCQVFIWYGTVIEYIPLLLQDKFQSTSIINPMQRCILVGRYDYFCLLSTPDYIPMDIVEEWPEFVGYPKSITNLVTTTD